MILKGVVCAAPMAGITDKPFRRIMRRFGEQILYTEMIGAESFVRRHPVTVKMMQVQDERNLIVQIVGANTNALVETALVAESMGAIGIDINMGCPVKKLISNGSGAALMKNPLKAAEIVSAVKKAVRIPVSVKIRSGWDNDHVTAPEFSRALVEAGADQITVHGRTKEQGYGGLSDTSVIQAVKNAVKIPVIANGDVRDRNSALALIKKTNADGIMVGRGCLGKPWILSEIETGIRPKVNLTELVDLHVDELLAYYGQAGIFIARKHIAWYASDYEGMSTFCQNIFKVDDLKVVKRLIFNFFKDKGIV